MLQKVYKQVYEKFRILGIVEKKGRSPTLEDMLVDIQSLFQSWVLTEVGI